MLLVEDNDDDVLFFCRGLRRRSILARPQVIRDGHKAIRYLKGKVFTEIDAPIRFLASSFSAFTCAVHLAWQYYDGYASTPLAGLPVIVFTGTDLGGSIHEAMENGADTYLLKGHDTDGLLHLLNA